MQNIRRSARDRRKRNKQEEQERISRDNTQEVCHYFNPNSLIYLLELAYRLRGQ